MNDQRPTLPAGSALQALTPFVWHSADAVRYEVALEMLCQQIAAATTRIGDERDSQQPDRTLIAELTRLQDELIDEQESLRPYDERTIEAVLAQARVRLDVIRSR